jgi:hypothetical protein
VCVYGLGLTLCTNVNVNMKFIYISCKHKCIRSIYVHVNAKHVNVKPCKFNLCLVKQCNRKKIQRIKSYEGKYLIFKNNLFAEMKISELINYLRNMSPRVTKGTRGIYSGN